MYIVQHYHYHGMCRSPEFSTKKKCIPINVCLLYVYIYIRCMYTMKVSNNLEKESYIVPKSIIVV